MSIQERLTKHYYELLTATPRGRALVLQMCVEGESNGEGRVFDRALARVDDPEVQKLIRRHREDELRHAQLFQACLDRQGVDLPPLPDELKMIDRLDRDLGGLLDREITSREDIMHVYLVLQVVEERAITQFAEIAPFFAEHDPETAAVFAEIGRDEERHLKYCHAISRKFAPDDATREEALRHYRQLEAKSFAENGRANMAHTLANGYVELGPLAKLVYRGFSELGAHFGTAPTTAFYTDEPLDPLGPSRELMRAAWSHPGPSGIGL